MSPSKFDRLLARTPGGKTWVTDGKAPTTDRILPSTLGTPDVAGAGSKFVRIRDGPEKEARSMGKPGTPVRLRVSPSWEATAPRTFDETDVCIAKLFRAAKRLPMLSGGNVKVGEILGVDHI